MGRDTYSNLVYGSRVTLYIVVLVLVIAAPIGLLIGSTAGYLGGKTDQVLMRITDIFFSFPRLVLALAFVASLGPGLNNAIIAIALTAWPAYARVARAETLAVRRSDFITAVRAQGAGSWRIIFRHIMPLSLPSVIVRATLDMAGIILTAAGLGFLGLGAQPPTPEWGAMIAVGRQNILDQWWVAGGARHGDLHRQPGIQSPGRRAARRSRSQDDVGTGGGGTRRWLKPLSRCCGSRTSRSATSRRPAWSMR